MSRPAARIGDLHSHGPVTGPVAPPCATNVLIGGLPAARIGDPTAGGGVLITGCPTVLIGDRSALAAAFGAAAVSGAALVSKDTCTTCNAVGPCSPAAPEAPASAAVVPAGPPASAGSPAPLPEPPKGTPGTSGVPLGAPLRAPGTAPKLPSKVPAPPRSMAETAARLERAAERISQARASGEPLPASPFTTQDKLRIAALGLDEKYIVRVTKTQYTGDDQGIGRPLASGKGAYWTTTFTQLEHADKDPELICQAVGVPYDPTSDYTLMVIDAEAAAAQGDQITMIPTYERLGALVKQELPDIDPADIDAVMTPEYSEEYLRLTERASSLGIRLTDSEDRREFAEQLGLDTNAKRALAVRSTIELEFGANPHFLGNGLTKNLDPRTSEEAPYGLLETFTFDRSPRTLGALAGSGALVKHPLARSSEATS